MAKGSRKRVARFGNDQSGCMWGLINIFDFRLGRPQRLLSDKKRGSKRIAGAAYASELNSENSSEICEDTDVGEQCETATTSKLSVKELMEEEMFVHPIGQINKSEEDPKQAVSGQHGHGKKNHWHSSKKSLDLRDISFVSEKPTHTKHKSLSSLDVTGMMAELCSQVNVKDVNLLNHDKTGVVISLPSHENLPVTEEKLGEATKVLVSHFVDGKNTKDGKIQPSGELMNALQLLNSNKDMFIKLLKDPNSQLVKHIEEFEGHQVSVDKKLKVRIGPELVEEGKNKHHSFFWRKLKGLDRTLSKKNEHPEDAHTIVVLKPGPASSQILGVDTKVQGERTSHFFFTDFTRRLKLAMRREQPRLGSFDKVNAGENLGMASPNRDHFFIEKIPKSSTKKGNKIGGSYEATSSREQQISDIYTEAKKHLADIVGKSDADGASSMQVPKSLGRFLSYSDYSCSPTCSPRKDGERSVVAPGNEITVQQLQEKNINDAGAATELCGCAEEIGNDLPILKDKCNPSNLAAEEIHAEGNMEIKSLDAAGQEKQVSSENLSEPCSLSTSRNEPVERVEETPKEFDENQTISLKADVESSPLSSPSVSSRTKDVENSDATTDRSERPSPISVLEPIFREDDVSPPSVKLFTVAESFQPRRIKFEDQITSAPCSRVWDEDRSSVFEFVKGVVHVSGLKREKLLERVLFSDHILDPSVSDHVDALSDRLCRDPAPLFDLIDEVLTDFCGRDFDGIPSLFTPFLQLRLKRKDIVDEIWDYVHWHLQSEHQKPTLDQVVADDFSRSWTWMDLRLECESMGFQIEQDILKELVEDTVMSLIDWNDGDEVLVLEM